MNYALFEDEHTAGLRPLVHCQPVFDLRCGAFTGRERAEALIGSGPGLLITRSKLVDVVRERTGVDTQETTIPIDLFLNGRLILTGSLLELFSSHVGEAVVFQNNGMVAACTAEAAKRTTEIRQALIDETLDELSATMTVREVDASFFSYPWDIIQLNGRVLSTDLTHFPLGSMDPSAEVSTGVVIRNVPNVYIGADAYIGAGVTIDAANGPVVVDRNATVMHQSVIVGPAYIGKGSTIKIGAKIYEQTSIGPVCKAGGEIEGSILAEYANKQHDGFLGHSYIGPWTNLGADTNTSDLKNNYSQIRATLEGEEFDTGAMFLGLIMADHSKCGINTMFNTGTTVGVGCNIYGGGFPPKYIPHFSWGGAEGLTEYDIGKFLETAERVMQRRNVLLTDAERTLLTDVFATTATQRKFN